MSAPPIPSAVPAPRPRWDPNGRITALDRLVAVFGGGGLLLGIYGSIGAAMARPGIRLYELPTFVDRVVPRQNEAAVVYGAIYALVLVPPFLMQDRRMLVRTALAYFGLVLSATPVWLLFPTTVPRLPVEGNDLFAWSLAAIHWIDPPTNCFPSMHVAESFLAAFLVRRMDRAKGAVMTVLAVAVWWSTVALGQHWFLDGLAGLALALLADRLAFGVRPLPAEALRPGPARGLVWPALLYAGIVAAFLGGFGSGHLPIEALESRWPSRPSATQP